MRNLVCLLAAAVLLGALLLPPVLSFVAAGTALGAVLVAARETEIPA